MKIELAKYNINELIGFFKKKLDNKNQAIYSDEFFCPFGIEAAMYRNQVMICIESEKIIAAVRFYPRKTDGIVSIYQFAIDEEYRRKHILLKMLINTGYKKFEALCPANLNFNRYYKKTGWILIKVKKDYNHWILEVEQ